MLQERLEAPEAGSTSTCHGQCGAGARRGADELTVGVGSEAGA